MFSKKPLTKDHGVNLEERPSKVNGKNVREHELWTGLLSRAYNENCHKQQPTYIGCSVSENFKSYTYFYDWCNKQIGFDQEGWHLDKDILVKGNKIYSEDTCCFVPQLINKMFNDHKNESNGLPTGVTSAYGGRFVARLSMYGKRVHLGTFIQVTDAYHAYKKAKESYVKRVVESYKELLDPRVYELLINFKVD